MPHGDQLGSRSGGSSSSCRRGLWLRLALGERHRRCTLREPSMVFEDRGPERRCPFGAVAVWIVVQFSKQRQAGPTPPLQRTLELFSSGGGPARSGGFVQRNGP